MNHSVSSGTGFFSKKTVGGFTVGSLGRQQSLEMSGICRSLGILQASCLSYQGIID